MKPVISWPGGKSQLAQTIIDLLPVHTCYCEVFGGGLAVLLAKDRSKAEVVNDIDQDLTNFYRIVKYHPNALLDELRLVLTSRREFYDYLVQPGLTDIQRAARWFFRNKNSFGGMMKHFGTSKTTAAPSIQNRLAAIELLSERLDKVLVENLDWRECLSRYDAKGTHFFLDPPYFGGYQYASPWKLDDHIDLRDYLFAIEGSWTLSYDDHPKVRELYQGCQLLEVNQRRGIGNNHANLRKDFPQLIISKAA